MAVQIYNKSFCVWKKLYENDADVRNKALEEVNEFFFHHDSVDIVNIIEEWQNNRDTVKLIVYYKDYT